MKRERREVRQTLQRRSLHHSAPRKTNRLPLHAQQCLTQQSLLSLLLLAFLLLFLLLFPLPLLLVQLFLQSRLLHLVRLAPAPPPAPPPPRLAIRSSAIASAGVMNKLEEGRERRRRRTLFLSPQQPATHCPAAPRRARQRGGVPEVCHHSHPPSPIQVCYGEWGEE